MARAQGIRKSLFPANTVIPSGATFDFVSGGANIKITFEDMVSQFGTTGTVVQGGDPLGTQVLDKNGSVNKIRSITAGVGIVTGLDALESVQISSGIVQEPTGQPVVADLATSNPILASFLPGSGIEVSKSDNKITISATGSLPATRKVTINQMSDFPAPVAGVITLADDTLYEIGNNLTTADRFVTGQNTAFAGLAVSVVSLTYTGTGIFFSQSTSGIHIENLTIACASGTLQSASAGAKFTWNNLCIESAASLGSLTTVGQVIIQDCEFQAIVDGFSFSGACGPLFVQSSQFTMLSGTSFDLGSATFTGISIINSIADLDVSSVFLDGAASSANLIPGALGTLLNNRFFGAGSPLNTITETDSQWVFFLNDSIADTRTDGLLSLQDNTVATIIVTTGVPVKVAGLWDVESVSQMTGNSGGRLTLDASKDFRLPIDCVVSIRPTSGGTQTMAVYVAINGNIVANSKRIATASPSTPASIACIWQETFSLNGFVEIFVANDSSTTDVLVESAIHRVN